MRRWILLGAFGFLAGCSGPSSDAREQIAAPPRDTFEPVADVLASHCGSLDCHGTKPRNLRIYGQYGLRIGGVTGGDPTTAEEYDATFLSVVMLEPTVLSEVVSQGGREPARLTMVRKGRGAEAHKGHDPMPIGSDADHCLLSWLASQPTPVECAAAAEIERPVIEP
jgi:hypothetical protein